MNLTIDMMLNLKKYGFSFEEFEHDCNPGLVYYFDNCEHIIGGKCDESPCTNEDQYIAEKGTWLPNASHLMLWLQWKQNCDVSIQYTAENRYFYGKVIISENVEINGSGPDLLCCLYKCVLKICKYEHSQKVPK